MFRNEESVLLGNWKTAGLGGIGLALLAAGSLAGTVAAPLARAAGSGDGKVTVRVVTEVDADGAYDGVLETGLAGVEVTLTDDAGKALTATTGNDGTAVLAPAASALTGGKYRVQVTNPEPGTLKEAVAGLGTGADVIRANVGFVDVSGGADVTYTTGFWEPDLYCQENPDLVTCGLAKGDATDKQGLVSFASGFSNTSPGGMVNQLTDNTKQQAVFGIGTDRTGNVYAGTSVKRQTAYGPAGAVNAVYRYNATSKAVTTFITLPGTLTAHDGTGSYLHDDVVYGRVGREGLGDVDVSGDGGRSTPSTSTTPSCTPSPSREPATPSPPVRRPATPFRGPRTAWATGTPTASACAVPGSW